MINSHQRNHGWNNQNSSNKSMNQNVNRNIPNYNGSYPCKSCRNSTLYEESNKPMGPVIKKHVPNDIDVYKNGKYPKYYNHNYNSTYFNTSNLPKESQRFQTITNVNATNNNSLYAWDTKDGSLVSGSNTFCRTIGYDLQLINMPLTHDDTQYFIFYPLDSGDFIIASQYHGRVLENIPDDRAPGGNLNSRAIIASPYRGAMSQFFQKLSLTIENFRLLSVLESDKAVNICDNNINEATKVTAVDTNSTNNLFRHDSVTRPIAFPSLPNSTTLEPIPELTQLNDSGLHPNEAPRAIIGNVFIPCIFVNDVIPLEQRIKQSPYYILQYQQYWHRLWASGPMGSGDSRIVPEATGISNDMQANMRHMIDMSIGADLGLRFFDRSKPFRQKILSGLNTMGSLFNIDLEETIEEVRITHPISSGASFVRYARGNEFTLTRLDGTQVSTWGMVDPDTRYLKAFPPGSPLVIEPIQ